jgi:hypothetical protein
MGIRICGDGRFVRVLKLLEKIGCDELGWGKS